jgi:hypothetical protein
MQAKDGRTPNAGATEHALGKQSGLPPPLARWNAYRNLPFDAPRFRENCCSKTDHFGRFPACGSGFQARILKFFADSVRAWVWQHPGGRRPEGCERKTGRRWLGRGTPQRRPASQAGGKGHSVPGFVLSPSGRSRSQAPDPRRQTARGSTAWRPRRACLPASHRQVAHGRRRGAVCRSKGRGGAEFFRSRRAGQ